MLNKNKRMEQLSKAGVNTGKYFTLDLPEGVTAGSKIHVIIDEKGHPVTQIVKENDAILEQIIEDGYVRNTKLHRRFVMAMMFRALNYKSYDGRKKGYTEWLHTHGFKYTFDMMIEEVRVLSKLEYKDEDTFKERSSFFTTSVVVQVMKDYMEELKKYIDKLHTYKCKGVPYKKVKGKNIFVADIHKKIYTPLKSEIRKLNGTGDYYTMHIILKRFMNNMIALPYETPKSKAWVDAYKGEGAFYTLKNLVMFHGCFIDNEGYKCYGEVAMKVLNARLNQYKGEGWRMFALLKKVIKDNGFSFEKRMEEIYNK